MKRMLAVISLALLGSPLFAQQDPSRPEFSWTALNLAVTDGHVLPAYQQFASAAATLVPAARALCTMPGSDTLLAMQHSFHESMDAWEGIQHIQFGPITYFSWNFRLQYWPDEKGTGARQLDTLIAAQDKASLEPESFARQSVGVQGFPALERLLFEDDSLQLLEQDNFRCQVLVTVADNISEIAAGVSKHWQEEFHTIIETADERGYFESSQDATVEFYKALEETVRKHQQQKLAAVLGDSLASARLRRAESWRSARSLRNIKFNVAALEHLFDGTSPALSSALLPEDAVLVKAAFTQLNKELTALPDDMASLLKSQAGYDQLKSVWSGLDAVFESLETALKHTDLYLGFNSLDGD